MYTLESYEMCSDQTVLLVLIILKVIHASEVLGATRMNYWDTFIFQYFKVAYQICNGTARQEIIFVVFSSL